MIRLTHAQMQHLFALHEYIRDHFTKMDWIKLAYLTNSLDVINDHPRLLRSLDFRDADYEGNSLQVLARIIDADPEYLADVDQFIAEKKAREKQSMANVNDEFISTNRPTSPERVIRFAPDVFQIPNKPIEPLMLSVMMPFEGRFNGTYLAIRNVCARLRITCRRADDIWDNSILIQDVFDLIFTSRVVITDFTDRNPNVFYETGVAHTLGKLVIPITQSVADIPFDLRHHRALTYLPNQEGLLKLEADLEKKLARVFST
ncbi:hypothetical protein [Fibrella arboris]|uniref:hypothetical protein n=1 Tax=Fibrella arboris TaxID=3242486 RepID=UPI003522AAEB